MEDAGQKESKPIQPKPPKQLRDILPSSGLWTVEDLAGYLGLPSGSVMQHLSDYGVKVLSMSTRYKHKIVRLEDVRVPRKESEHEPRP